MISYVEFVVSENLILLLIFPKHSMFNNAIQNCPSLISGQNRHEKKEFLKLIQSNCIICFGIHVKFQIDTKNHKFLLGPIKESS